MPDLEIANAFDARVDARLKFNNLTTSAKLDLLINDLLPDFFTPECCP
ncbi:MAG: hypothetical protein L3J36_01085 [Rhodobacteraceae bacterium]|nr:hypothetical protein [Paracoccaceae bacterium]